MKCALEETLREAGRLMLSFHAPKVTDKGGHANYVTEADEAVQAFLLEKLSDQFPEACFFAEEKDDNVLTDAPTFIVDPIDGTTNYFRSRASSVISVGLVQNKRPVLGAIYDPYRDMLYHAEVGQGAWCGGERLQVSDLPMNRALVELGTGPYYDDLMELTGRTVGRLLPQIADFRRSGSAALDLTHLANGTAEGMFEWMLQPWDYCAGVLLVEEAGGKCGSILGGPVTYERGIPFMAANAACFDELQAALQKIHREMQTK